MVLTKCKLGLAVVVLVAALGGAGSRMTAPLEAAPTTAAAKESERADNAPRPESPGEPRGRGLPDTRRKPPPASEPVAILHGNVAITRQELGEFLIERYGAEKLEALVNQRIVALACARKGIEVTPREVEAAIDADLKSLKVSREEFVGKVLKQYGKSLFEWKEDVIKPRLLLAKLGQTELTVGEPDLRREFETRYGAKVRCKVLIWPKGYEADAIRDHNRARNDPKEADRLAHATAWGTLQEAGGRVFVVSRHADDADGQRIADEAFRLKPGELSPLFPVGQETYALLCVDRVAADADKDFEQEKAHLLKGALERKLDREVPRLFESLRKEARPELLLPRK